MKTKIALVMIVKDNSEATIFERCLKSFMPYMAGLYVAVTGISGEHDKIHALVKKFKGKSISTSPTTHPKIYSEIDGKTVFSNFAEARNVSFSLVDKTYDYLAWADVDDVINNGEELAKCAEIAKRDGLDSVFFTYWYALHHNRSTGQPTDVAITQVRERLLKPNVFKWVSRLHEVAVPIDDNYKLKQKEWDMKDGRQCVWIHLTEQQRVDSALNRNRQILEIQIEEEGHKDPRTLFSLAKVYFDLGEKEYLEKAKQLIYQYLELSGWDAERSDALEYLGLVFEKLGDWNKAIEIYHRATFEYPSNLMAYLRLANAYFETNRDQFAIEWLDTAVKKKLPDADAMIHEPFDIKYLSATLKLKEAQKKGDLDQALYWADIRVKLLGDDSDGMYESVREHKEANDIANNLLQYAVWLKTHKFEAYIPRIIDAMPPILGNLPFAQMIANSPDTAVKHDKKSIVYFASFGAEHFEKWDWTSLERGIGGSETAVVKLTEEWAKHGYDVTVYADVEESSISPSGVKWEHWYKINWHDKFNVLILWRSPHLLDRKIKAKKLFMDLHDVASQMDWTDERMKLIDKVFFKSKYHRVQIPKLPDSKAVIISNGL